MSSVAPMELSSSVVMCGVTMVTSSPTSTNTSMLCELALLARFSPTSLHNHNTTLSFDSEVPKEKTEDSINLEAPRKREKPTGDQEMVTIKKVATGCFTLIHIVTRAAGCMAIPKHKHCSPPLLCYQYIMCLLAYAFKALLTSVQYTVGMIHCLITVSFCLTELQFLFPEGSSLVGLGKETSQVLQKNSNDILHHTK